ncbi:apical junction molecule-like isoform X7 [Gallus gallus]|uniref:apical junction molecule-like isoform X3 n=1 Tax=Gallus gallus TaxID=9031 RepID=UPI0000E8209C|nr:apical junction molecule-like isoform X3 [Gallus gallus]XP_025002163.1 apical junction molecule-like isoform X2 [Gallus gallus]XP_040512735.1 apical junction molecule-like isoform X1 [Gallus gallus]XP_040512737.1 apical junction molecule-like isoform X2 [Gallus gallus]XP_040550529.1 apical junction molecule-like isoform X3 [Gallus gallus]XP_040550576.1 apical junction molecule-like isoform X5 [Gallus gallus]XP_040550578.1 apical junction molecule-like isoform X1 [Gallus gallus]XP_04055061|eukprot:XP_025002149.1 apical junction molecule-like isoform X2 [Gallus gallus]
MRAQFASGTLTDLQRVNLLEELLQAHERAVEKRKAEARESLMKDAQQIRAERTAARKEDLEQEKQFIAQLEDQLKAETEEIEVLRQERQRLQEEREELELEGAWQQHQLELEAAHVPGAVLPELVEAELEKAERARRRGLAFWMKMICLIFVSLQLLLVTVLGCAVLYAQNYDQELLYRLLLRVLPQAMYASLAYFASRSLRVVCDGLLPI